MPPKEIFRPPGPSIILPVAGIAILAVYAFNTHPLTAPHSGYLTIALGGFAGGYGIASYSHLKSLSEQRDLLETSAMLATTLHAALEVGREHGLEAEISDRALENRREMRELLEDINRGTAREELREKYPEHFGEL